MNQTFKENFRGILIPYFFTAIAVELLHLLAEFQLGDFGKSLFWVFYGTGPHLKWVGMWFLPHLFLVSIFCWAYLTLIHTHQIKWYFQVVLLTSFLIIGWLSIRSFWGMPYPMSGRLIKVNGLPFSADILLISSFYFLLGTLGKGWIKEQRFQFIPLAVAMIVFIGLHAITNFSTDLNLRRYDNPIVATTLALTGSFIVIAFSKWLVNFTMIEKILGYFGRNSLVILLFHSFFQDTLFVFLSGYTKRFFYVGMATFVAAILGSVLVVEIINRVKFLQLIYKNSKAN